MGISILELVVNRLREVGFRAESAYPGQKLPPITAPVAAVHIEKVDRESLNVTVEVTMLCPAAMGGTACELEALRATEELRWLGATCIQQGCRYDGVSQVYGVSILASFTAVTGSDSCTVGPGFHVYVADRHHQFVTGFSAEEQPEYVQEFAMGQRAPAGIRRGPGQWQLLLEERIPAGSPEDPEPGADFKLLVVTDRQVETYKHCDWTSVRREYSRDGLRRICRGVALERDISQREVSVC